MEGFPRCDICGKKIRIRGLMNNAWCSGCISKTLPFVGLISEGDYKGAIRDFREGLGSRASEFQDMRFDPFGDEEKEALKDLDQTLKRCSYTGGDEMATRFQEMAKKEGCSLAMMCHNIRSARGPALELLEAELRRWKVSWDLIGLTETWLDADSEKLMRIAGFTQVCASRKVKSGGGVALLVREGLIFRERPDLGVFIEGFIETVFVEIVRGGNLKNEIIGVVYRPPGGDLAIVNEELGRVLTKTRGHSVYIMGDFNVDLLKAGSHRPTADFLQGFYEGGFYPLVSLPTRITDTSATLIDNIWTNNLEDRIESGLVTVRISDHLPIYSFLGGKNREGDEAERAEWRRRINDDRIFRFSEDLKAWTYDEVRSLGIEANVANFRNGFRDLYDAAFPWVKRNKKKKDIEKPWLDDNDFKNLVKEKGELYSKKIKNKLDQDGVARLAEVSKQVNAMRQKLKRRYFRTKLEDRKGDLRQTWEVLGEVLKGRANKHGGVPCKYFEANGQGITDGDKIAAGFCDFYCKVGPDLAKRIGHERNCSFRDFLGDRVSETLFLCPTTPKEIEELCKNIEASKGMGTVYHLELLRQLLRKYQNHFHV